MMQLAAHRRILIIDDNPSIHDDFRKILGANRPNTASLCEKEALLFGDSPETEEDVHFEVDSAFQGQEGLDRVVEARANGCPYSLAFVDIRMPPGWDGVETLEQICAAETHQPSSSPRQVGHDLPHPRRDRGGDIRRQER